MNVEKIVGQLDIRPGMAVADFGAGHGFFSIAFAKKVGSSGQVFAVDIQPAALEAIRSQARIEGLFNIKLVIGDLEKAGGSSLADESCDLVFLASALFQISNKSLLINEAHRVLKKDGKLAVIEWKPYIALGPQKELRFSEEELKRLIAAEKFGELKSIDAGSHHYGFIFLKNVNY